MTKTLLSLADKRILYVAPRFFGYDQDIEEELRSRGADVVRLYDRPFDTPFMTAMTKVAPKAISWAALPLYQDKLSKELDSFDFVFVVNGQTLSPEFIKFVRNHSPNTIIILYLWDSLLNRSSVASNLNLYDFVFGFDKIDAERYKFHYRPLYFFEIIR